MKALLIGSIVLAQLMAFSAAKNPDIVVVLADDMGYSDIGCFGGEIQTPTLDRLAYNGLRMTQFYNTARCCPTRASLLTGLYPHQAGIGHMMQETAFPGYRGNLNRRCVTMGEVMRAAGYATGAFGKWHVARDTKPEGPKFNWPLQRGFDRFYGTIHGAGSFFDPSTLCRGNDFIAPDRPDFYYTDAIADEAAKFIREVGRERRLFAYVAFTATHWPMHAKPGDIAKYQGMYDRGWDAIREARYRRMRALGIIGEDAALSPRDARAPPWDDEPMKAWNARCMEVYAAMLDCMDQGVGRIVAALEETGRLNDTLMFFIADNGGCAEAMGRNGPEKVVAGADQAPPLAPGDLQPDMIPRRTRDGKPIRQGSGVMPGPADTFIGYGLPWANVSNTPFREYKHWVHEGGISSPLVVHWPTGIAARQRNTLRSDPAHLVDIMATCVDVAGATYPAEVAGEEIQPMEGVSLRPAFEGGPITRPSPIFWEHEGNRALRQGRWKIVAKHNGPWELYDIGKDRSELNDLAPSEPERVRGLAALWQTWAARSNVLPWPVGDLTEDGGKRSGNRKARRNK